jgi:UDP-N-acetylglucosamine 1-carboxyvinyltransferase
MTGAYGAPPAGAAYDAAMPPNPSPPDRFRVVGGARLVGEVRVTGAKNSVLKTMAAALLAEGRTTLTDVPRIYDTLVMCELLRRLGCQVDYDVEAAQVVIDVPAVIGHQADYDLVRRIRASICVLGPLIARCGAAEVAMPGGDQIGSRPLDFHIAGLAKLGAQLESEHGYIIAKAPQGLTGATVWLDFPSVGATENVLMASVLARGTTVIDNAAREPEIVDLVQMLEQMGAKIDGGGTSTLTIEGVDRLSPTDHVIVPDRIVAGTWAFAAVMTRGDITVRNARPEHLEIALDKLSATGAVVEGTDDGFHVSMDRRPTAIDAVTLPYPGLATDLQPVMMALNSVAEGAAMITENIFEGRFVFAHELMRLGANVRTDGHHAIVRGLPRLSGAPVRASDIRAGAALTLAGLVAEGVTHVSDIYHVDRGYPGFDDQLRALGADVTREPDPDAEFTG